MNRFKCIRCDDIKDQVRTCANNHLVCESCFENQPEDGKRCKKCWTTFGQTEANPIRNKMRMACSNHARGCDLMLTGESMASVHSRECAFRDFECIGKKLKIWNCNWIGLPTQCARHLQDQHSHQIGPMQRSASDFGLYIDFTRMCKIKWVNVLGSKFICRLSYEPAEDRLSIVFMVLGDSEFANLFYLKLQLHDPKDDYNIVQIESPICSDHLELEELMSEKRCITFTKRTVQKFADANGVLSFRYLIKRK